MTAKELRETLTKLGWTRAELARKVGVSANSVSAWTLGKAAIPGPAVAYLRLRLAINQAIGDLAQLQ